MGDRVRSHKLDGSGETGVVYDRHPRSHTTPEWLCLTGLRPTGYTRDAIDGGRLGKASIQGGNLTRRPIHSTLQVKGGKAIRRSSCPGPGTQGRLSGALRGSHGHPVPTTTLGGRSSARMSNKISLYKTYVLYKLILFDILALLRPPSVVVGTGCPCDPRRAPDNRPCVPGPGQDDLLIAFPPLTWSVEWIGRRVRFPPWIDALPSRPPSIASRV